MTDKELDSRQEEWDKMLKDCNDFIAWSRARRAARSHPSEHPQEQQPHPGSEQDHPEG